MYSKTKYLKIHKILSNKFQVKVAIVTILEKLVFTSTAYISKAHKTPAIYLDPTGKLDKEYYANIEVPLLSSKVELFKWFESL